MLDESNFADIIRSPDEIAKHFSSDDVESALRDGIRLQWLLLKPEDRNSERLYGRIEDICRRLVPEVSNELQKIVKK